MTTLLSPPQNTPSLSRKSRGSEFLERSSVLIKEWYSSDGTWMLNDIPSDTRERYWYCLALYATGENELADAIIRKGKTDTSYLFRCPTNYHNFHTNIAARLLRRHKAQMAADVRQKLHDLVEEGFGLKPGNRQPDYQFTGSTDNKAGEACVGLLLGGDMLGAEEAIEHGLWSLRQFRALLTRTGINSEYNSPTYSPHTLCTMADIVDYAQNEEARQIALGIEHRLWIDLAARFHPEMGVVAGPHSRAYSPDLLTNLNSLAAMLWFVIGDDARPSPMELFDADSQLIPYRCGYLPFAIAQFCFYASANYHLPESARGLFRSKSYPFKAIASSEIGSSINYPARPAHIETYLTEDFTIGTASTQWLDGQNSTSYFVTYKRSRDIHRIQDVGTIYTRVAINGEEPGAYPRPTQPVTHLPSDLALSEQAMETKPLGVLPDGDAPLLLAARFADKGITSNGNTITLQSDTTALVLTHPHLSLSGNPGRNIKEKKLSSIQELLIFPSFFGGADEILMGGKQRSRWDGRMARGQWLACRRGRLLIAIRPLVYTHSLGEPEIELKTVHQHELLRTTFYQGEARRFTEVELSQIYGGFIAEHASVDEYSSLEAFAEDLESARFTDYFWFTRRVRYRRAATPRRPALEMEAAWSPGSTQPRFALLDGQSVDRPVVKIDGLSNKDIPFINDPWRTIPGHFPWPTLSAAQADWPGAIGDREYP